MAQSKQGVPQIFKTAEGRTRYLEAYNAALKDWPVPCEELDMPTTLGMTHVIASGPHDAPAILLLPSLAASAVMWGPTVPALSDRFRVYAVDVIGQAGKSVPARRIRNRREMGRWLVELLDALHIQRAALVGSSYGGFLAVNQALLSPERVDRIVLISPAATFKRFPLRFYIAMFVKGPLRRIRRRRRASKPMSLPGGTRLEPTGWGRLMAVTMAESARPNAAPAIVFDKRDLKTMHMPVLLLIGEKEVLYNPDETIALAKSLVPDLTGAVISGADHLASISQPEAVNRHVLNFLGGRP